MTIKTTLAEAKIVQVEIEVPLSSFHKWLDSFYTHIDETGRIVEVFNLDTRSTIRCLDPNDTEYGKTVNDVLKDFKPCTAEEYWKAYTKAHAATAVKLEFHELISEDIIKSV